MQDKNTMKAFAFEPAVTKATTEFPKKLSQKMRNSGFFQHVIFYKI